MLNINKNLYFPHIQRLTINESSKKDCWLLNWKNKLFMLNWDKHEQNIKKQFYYKENTPPIPEFYDNMLNKLLFAPTYKNLVAIRKHCWQALLELNITDESSKSLLKETTMIPCVAFVKTAFLILADSIFGNENEPYSKDYSLKVIAFHSMLYKFWCFQVKPELICRYAGLEELSSRNNIMQSLNKSEHKEINVFLAAIQKHQKTIQVTKGQTHVKKKN